MSDRSSLLDFYGGPDPASAASVKPPTGWGQAPPLPEWLKNKHDPLDAYVQLQKRNPADALSLEGESTRNFRSKHVLFESKTPIRYVVYADGHGCQTIPRTLIRPKVPTVFPSYIGEKSLGENPHKIFDDLLQFLRVPHIRSPDGTLSGAQFLYLAHLLRTATFSPGSPLSVNLPQFPEDAVPDLFLFAPGKLFDDDYAYGHVVRNPAVFMMIDTFTGDVVDLGSKYLTHTYDATSPKVKGLVVSTTSPAYMRDDKNVHLSDVYNIIEREIGERRADMNQVALILQSCRVSSDGSSMREQSPTRAPKYMGGKKKQRRRQTRNRKYKLSKKKLTKRVRRS